MLHARRDYDAIQDPSGKIGEDEPVFLLRAKDVLAPILLRAYADLVRQRFDDLAFVENVEQQAARMIAWQEQHGKQRPSAPPGSYRDFQPDQTKTTPGLAAKQTVQPSPGKKPTSSPAPPPEGWEEVTPGEWRRTQSHPKSKPVTDILEAHVKPASPPDNSGVFVHPETPIVEGPRETVPNAPLSAAGEALMLGQPKPYAPSQGPVDLRGNSDSPLPANLVVEKVEDKEGAAP